MKRKSALMAAIASMVWFASPGAYAAPITFTGSGAGPGGVGVSAAAVFDIVGNTLTINLRNTSPSNNGQDVPGSTLTGLFWDLTGNPTLTPVSATVASGSSIIQANRCDAAPCTGETNVGGEFGYQATTSFGHGSDRGIASTGYLSTGLPQNIGNFKNGAAGKNLDNPKSLDGINFGIVSAASGFNPNGGLATEPLISDTVTFVLTGVSGLTTTDISHVSFQYGTRLSELNIPGKPGTDVPEPVSIALFGLGLFGLGMTRRRKVDSRS